MNELEKRITKQWVQNAFIEGLKWYKGYHPDDINKAWMKSTARRRVGDMENIIKEIKQREKEETILPEIKRLFDAYYPEEGFTDTEKEIYRLIGGYKEE